MHWHELYKKNPAELTDKELSDYISDIKKYRVEETNCLSLSANECNMLLSLAHGEKTSRSSSKLARIAIWVSVFSVVVSVILGAIGILGC